ncbi:hypothetical protein MA16_Dca019070 [Dendrobium catenatum]|uniref:Uncharacterized protein n=1 Tax=Dendrobium catenatum TaxID=906689 RepID=A0A2I0VUA3_9ASPA|nr:hypothetical protein MA16_Dca019070 [Dendrobium catenatum]
MNNLLMFQLLYSLLMPCHVGMSSWENILEKIDWIEDSYSSPSEDAEKEGNVVEAIQPTIPHIELIPSNGVDPLVGQNDNHNPIYSLPCDSQNMDEQTLAITSNINNVPSSSSSTSNFCVIIQKNFDMEVVAGLNSEVETNVENELSNKTYDGEDTFFEEGDLPRDERQAGCSFTTCDVKHVYFLDSPDLLEVDVGFLGCSTDKVILSAGIHSGDNLGRKLDRMFDLKAIFCNFHHFLQCVEALAFILSSTNPWCGRVSSSFHTLLMNDIEVNAVIELAHKGSEGNDNTLEEGELVLVEDSPHIRDYLQGPVVRSNGNMDDGMFMEDECPQ